MTDSHNDSEENVLNDTSESNTRTRGPLMNRRKVLAALAGTGIGTLAFQRALAAQASKKGSISSEMIQQSEWIAGIELSEEDRKATAKTVSRAVRGARQLDKVKLENSIPPALHFQPLAKTPAETTPPDRTIRLLESSAPKLPQSEEKLAFLPVTELAALVKSRQISSMQLTKLYLKRLKKYRSVLKCVVTLTEELALKQAAHADREIAAGRYRGPLHGIPWGAKDLVAYPGYKTTWGATPFKDQELEMKATVAQRLDNAGAVLVAKLSMGALAMGDKWFEGMTRNPWNPKQGSSGSSAGPASATAAGLVGFSLGSETLGSIVSPSRRCGTTGLRPTFGRVSRYGCMALSWSMDKIGPLTRSVEDCALVFNAIHGADGLDMTAQNRPFQWPSSRNLRGMKVGFFNDKKKKVENRAELKVLKDFGVKLVPIELPTKIPVFPLITILNVESATAFEEITRKGITEGLNTWPNTFRSARFVSAVDYVRANRVRTLLMEEMEKMMEQVDCYVQTTPRDLFITNLTGHPTVVMPNGFRKRKDGVKTPFSILFTGQLYGEADLLSLSNAYQQVTGENLKHPDMKKLLEYEKEMNQKKKDT